MDNKGFCELSGRASASNGSVKSGALVERTSGEVSATPTHCFKTCSHHTRFQAADAYRTATQLQKHRALGRFCTTAMNFGAVMFYVCFLYSVRLSLWFGK